MKSFKIFKLSFLNKKVSPLLLSLRALFSISKQFSFSFRQASILFFIKKALSFLFKRVLNLLIIFQLAVSPAYGANAPSQRPNKKQTPEEKAQEFNKKHVESLRKFIFGARDPKDYYTNHPLDTFSLLGQAVIPPTAKERKSWLSSLRKQKGGDEIKEETTQRKQRRDIKLENIFVEIISAESGGSESLPSESKNKPDRSAEISEVAAALAHSSRLSLAEKTLPENLRDKLSPDSVFINDSQKRLSFRLSHHDQVIQTFPQNIEWMVFFGDYLVFLEAPKVSSSKALLSFIDLRYFEKAIGKTALPLFQIPVHYKTAQIKPRSLLKPEVLTVEEAWIDSFTDSSVKSLESILKIADLEISESQLSFLSSLQQLNFNATVSLLNKDNSQMSLAYLKEIIRSYSESLSSSQLDIAPVSGKISLDTKQMTLKMLENRKAVGSAENISGPYGHWNKLSYQLSDDSKTAQDFKESLTQDKAFQAELSKTYEAISKKRAFYSRYFAFLNHLTGPQPLGAPEITRSLALIANSVSLKKDTVKNRFEAFKEGMKQFLYPKKNRLILSSAVLAGAGAIYPLEMVQSSLFVLTVTGDWLSRAWELVSVTGSASVAWVNPTKLYSTYVEGSSLSHLLTGITALFGSVLVTVGFFHYSINIGDLIQNMKLEPVHENQSRVRRLLNSFISYKSRDRSKFFEDLGNAEKKKFGVEASIDFGSPPAETHFLFNTTSNLSYLYSALESTDLPLSLELKIEKGDVVTEIDFIQKTEKSQDSGLDPENQITFRINGSSAVFITTDTEIKLKSFFDPETNKLLPDLSLSLDLSREDMRISGILRNVEFTDSENKKVESVLNQIKKENNKRASLKNAEPLSGNQVTTLYQALGELSLGYSSWAKTFRFLGLSWNWFFIGRHIVTRPALLPKVLYYSKYFKVSEEGHIPSFFNGGRQDRLTRSVSQLQLGFKNMKAFEERVKAIEKAFLKEVKAQSYLAAVEEAGAERKSELTALGPDLNLKEVKSKRLKIFYSLYKRELFQESMKAYLGQILERKSPAGADAQPLFNLLPIQTLDAQPLSNQRLKREGLKTFIESPDLFKFPPTAKEIRKIVEETAEKQEIAQKSRSAADHLISGFLKRVQLALENKAQDNLNSKVNLQMQRAEISKRMLNEPESLARATRQQISSLVVDKPIEILYTFVFLAGVDQGILKVLHDQAFTEEAWFHLGRYAIWAGFFSSLIMNVLAGVWMKTQMDARLEETQAFDVVPTEEEARKGYLSWIKKQFSAKDNTWWANQFHSIKLAYANLLPATITMAMIWALTLGRFDIEVYLAGYLIYFVTPLMGLGFKIENTFEKSAGYAYRGLIEKGLDLSAEDKKLLSHPKIQEYYMKKSSQLRRQFNLWLALIYNNPVGHILDIFANTDVSYGSRGLVRLFSFGEIPTQHWVNFMDFLENKQILSSDFAEKCKSIFTNNRPDIK